MSALKDKEESWSVEEEIKAMEEAGIKIVQKIGSGTYGVVYEADIDGNLEAAKLVRPRQGKISYPSEFDIMARVINRYVLYTEGAFFPSTIKGVGTVITMPLGYDTSHGMSNEPYHKISFLRKFAEGLNCLHRCGVLHLDIKPVNIFLFDREIVVKNNRALEAEKTYFVPEPMIGDFGLSRTTRSIVEGEFIPAIIGTVSYRAPEHFNEYYDNEIDGANKFIYRGSTDVWSYGATIFTILNGKNIFPEEMRKNKYPREDVFNFLEKTFKDKVTKRKFLSSMIKDELAVDLLSLTLEWDYKKRITMSEVIAHPLFRDIITPLSTCKLLSPDWPLTPEKGTEPLIRDIVKYASSILIDGDFKNVTISVLFHAIDIIYRFGAYNDLNTLITQQFKIDLALVAVYIALKYKGYRITQERFLAQNKEILDRFERNKIKYEWSWKRLLEIEEDIYNNFSLIIYRRFLYDSAKSAKELAEFYQEYALKPENYYTFDPKPVDPLKFKNLDDPFFAHKTIKDFFNK